MENSMSRIKGSYSHILGALIYFLGALVCLYFDPDFSPTPKNPVQRTRLPLVRSLASVSDPGSSLGPIWGLWGPVTLPRGRRIRAEIADVGRVMKWDGRVWLNGRASVIAAEDLKDSSGELPSAEEIKAFFQQAEHVLESGRKVKILDVYGFPFMFWKDKWCSGKVSYRLIKNIGTRGRAQTIFIPHKKGAYYVLLEYSSNRKSFPQESIAVTFEEDIVGTTWPFFLGFVFLLALSISRVSRISGLPKSVRFITSFIRRGAGNLFMGSSILASIAIFGLYAEDVENGCVQAGAALLLAGLVLAFSAALFMIGRSLKKE